MLAFPKLSEHLHIRHTHTSQGHMSGVSAYTRESVCPCVPKRACVRTQVPGAPGRSCTCIRMRVSVRVSGTHPSQGHQADLGARAAVRGAPLARRPLQ